MIQKLKDVVTNINVSNIDNGFIGANFYTEDDGSAYIRITIKDNDQTLDFTQTDMTPRLDLFSEDGSIFTNEPIDILLPKDGVIQYKVSDNVIKHSGRVDAKLFLANDKDSVHVANFFFTITDSGMTGPIGKEIHVDSLQDLVRKVMKENAIGLLDDSFKTKLESDLQSYVSDNSDKFKGAQGDKGEKGEKGDKGDTGEQGAQGIQGEPGKDGRDGVDGKDGINGTDGKDGLDGVDGKPFTFEDFTTEQLKGLQPELPDMSNWQKTKLTNDDGSTFYDENLVIDFNDNEQLSALPNGTRYVVKAINIPSGASSVSGWVSKWSRSDSAVMLVKFQPYNSIQVFQKRFYNDWNDWETVIYQKVDTKPKISNLITSFSDGTTLSSTGNTATDDKNVTTDYIDVSADKKYTLGVKNVVDTQHAMFKIAYYDSNKSFLSLVTWSNLATNNNQIITPVANAKYTRIVINKEHKNEIFFNEGETPYYKIADDSNDDTSSPSPISKSKFKSQRPYPSKVYWQLLDANTNIKPLELSRDGKVIFASNGSKISQSTDEGNTWVDVGGTVNGTLIQSIRYLDDGELLIGTTRDSTTNVKSKLFKTSGYNVNDPSKVAFNQVLEMNSPNANFNNPWCLDHYYNIVLSSEYGGHYLDGARYVYLSTDYGKTWTTIFDQKAISETVNGAPAYTTDAHVHTCHYDRYRDRIWVCVGDQDNTAVYYSDDLGKTWNVIKGFTGKDTMQYTGIISYPEGVFLGSDRSPDGIYYWNPNKPEVIEPFYLTERDSIRTLVYALPFRRFAKKDEVTYFVANRDDIVDGKKGPIIVALKGVYGAQTLYDFTDDFSQYVITDISGCLGETVNGNIIVSVKDKNTNKYRLLRTKAPVWE